MADLIPVDPFVFYVNRDRADSGTTLLDVSNLTRTPISDLLSDANNNVGSINEPLAEGTTIQLPRLPHPRGTRPARGSYFEVREAEELLQKSAHRRADLLNKFEKEFQCDLSLPARSVSTITEQVLDLVHTETERLHNPKYFRARRGAPLDGAPMAQRKTEVLEKFTQNTNSLFCFKPEYQNCMKSSQREISDNALTPGTMTTCTDSSDDFCVNPHTQRLEFMFFFGNGYAADSVWAVLPCQKLTVLIDAVRCTLGACPPLNARNAFLFIAGVFYIDDRHKGEEGYEDISALIRNHDPTGTATDSWQACNAGFGKCPVKSAAETTFSEIRLKMGDWCVLRHEGGLCSHMFYLREITPLGENSRKERSQFPHRTALRKRPAIRCEMCRTLPSTICLYGDPLSVTSPSYYCLRCYHLLHGEETEEEAKLYSKVTLPDPLACFQHGAHNTPL